MAQPAILLRVMRVLRVQSRLVARSEMAEADVLIAPAVRVPGMSAHEERQAAIAAGYAAASAALASIRSRLAG